MKTIFMTKAELDALPEYSATLPTGTVPGRRWKRHDGAHDQEFLAEGNKPVWLVGEYGAISDDGKSIAVNWYVPVPPLTGEAA